MSECNEKFKYTLIVGLRRAFKYDNMDSQGEVSMSLQEMLLNYYKSITPQTVKNWVPIFDYFRKRKNKPPIPIRERLCEVPYPDLGDKVVMLHGVSVGEIISLENLIKKIKSEFPEYKIALTTGTVTGQDIAKKKYGEIVDFITYFPLDVYESCRRFVKKLSPSIILIAETEIWPNFAEVCKERKIPLYIINGRISDESYKSYLKFKNFLKPALRKYSAIYCQSEVDKDRFIAIGADPKVCAVMKNLKFEISKKECDIDLKAGDAKVLIAGSTHKGEEEIVLKVYNQLKSKIIDLKLILAPRHNNRIDEVLKVLQKTNFKYGLRTKNATFENNDIVVIDTLGELSKLYALADVAFIGGSFNKTGGHNPLEATIYSKPAVSGPSIKNFRDIYAILQREKAAYIVKDEVDMGRVLKSLLLESGAYNQATEGCEKCIQDQQGALEFVVGKLKEILK